MRMSRARSRSPHRASPAPLNHRQRATAPDRKSTRLNSSHGYISHAVFCLKEQHGVPADEVDLINHHGTSTPLGDRSEAEAIWTVFRQHTPPIAISATKSMTGHMMCAAHAL